MVKSGFRAIARPWSVLFVGLGLIMSTAAQAGIVPHAAGFPAPPTFLTPPQPPAMVELPGLPSPPTPPAWPAYPPTPPMFGVPYAAPAPAPMYAPYFAPRVALPAPAAPVQRRTSDPRSAAAQPTVERSNPILGNNGTPDNAPTAETSEPAPAPEEPTTAAADTAEAPEAERAMPREDSQNRGEGTTMQPPAGNDTSEQARAASAPTYPAYAEGTPLTRVQTEAGTVLADAEGMSLYTFDADPTGESICYGQCARNWPPVLAGEDAAPTGELSLITRNGGETQWAFEGKALYRWVGDRAPGDTTGDGVNDIWRVVVLEG